MPALPVLIKVGVILLVLVALVWGIHHEGRMIERGECTARDNAALIEKNNQLLAAEQLLAAATKRNAALAAENLLLNSEVTKHASEKMERAALADATLRRDPRGLRVPREICAAPAVRMPGPAPGAGNDNADGRDDRVRLPRGIETGLYDLTLKANKVAIKRDECREFALGLARQREEWERRLNEKTVRERPD
jgi:hypothetical protein